ELVEADGGVVDDRDAVLAPVHQAGNRGSVGVVDNDLAVEEVVVERNEVAAEGAPEGDRVGDRVDPGTLELAAQQEGVVVHHDHVVGLAVSDAAAGSPGIDERHAGGQAVGRGETDRVLAGLNGLEDVIDDGVAGRRSVEGRGDGDCATGGDRRPGRDGKSEYRTNIDRRLVASHPHDTAAGGAH